MAGKIQYLGTGRRKTSVARVRLIPGEAGIIINGKDMREYFGGRELLSKIVEQPLELTETLNKYGVKVNVGGGGSTGQAGAIRHGVSRALLEADESFKNDLLTNEILADVKASAKDSFNELFSNLIIYKSGIDNDIRSLKIYNKRILIIGDNIPEKSKFKILDAIINLSVDVELPENKIRRAKEFFNSKIIEGYTDYLFDQEAS